MESATDIVESFPHIAQRIGSRDMSASFRWGGNLDEMAAALSAAATLAKLTDGIYFYPDDDILYDADEAIEATRNDLAGMTG